MSSRKPLVHDRIEEDAQGRRHAVNACTSPCSIEQGMRIIGGKWTGTILWHLQDGPVRFNDLARIIAGASKKMITDRLRQLEAQGLVRREVMATSPVSVQYDLTELGRTALSFLDELRKWTESLPTAEPEVD
ncbi:MAG: helix-turn-helix transcriptional regulator [Pelagimonas sp.]